MRDELLALYRRTGVLSNEYGLCLDWPLYWSCPSAHTCWEGLDVPLESNECNRIQLTYVGPLYGTETERLLVVGLNLNEAGGLAELEREVRLAQGDLRRGAKRIDFDAPGYAGTLFWHRVAAYSCLWLDQGEFSRNHWHIEGEEVMVGDRPLAESTDALDEVWYRLALTEAIKCSPDGDRSSPSDAMRSECPPRFFAKEMAIVAPKALMVIGKETLPLLGLEDLTLSAASEDGAVRLFEATYEGRRLRVMNVVHTAAYGGSAKAIILNMAKLLESGIAKPDHHIETVASSPEVSRTWRILNPTLFPQASAHDDILVATVGETPDGFAVTAQDEGIRAQLMEGIGSNMSEASDLGEAIHSYLGQYYFLGWVCKLNE